MADILGIFNHIQQQGEKGKQSRLARMLGEAYNAPMGQRQEALGRVAQVDGGLAMQASRQFREEDGEVLSQLSDHARQVVALYKANPNMAQQAYQAMLPLAQRVGISDAPTKLDDTIIQGLTQLAAVNSKAGVPAGYQEFDLLSQAGGLSPEERAKAAKVRLGLEGRASNAGYGFDMVEDAYGNPRPQRRNPRDGSVEVFHSESGQWVPLGAGAPQGAPQASYGQTGTAGNPAPQGFVDQTAELANQMIAAGIPEQQVEAFIASRLNPGQQAAPAPAGGPPMQPAAAGLPGIGSGLGVGRRKEDEAYATKLAEGAAGLQLAPQQAQAKAEEARLVKEAEAEVEREIEAPKRIAKYQQALATAENVGVSVDKALGMIGPLTTGLLGARLRGVEGTPAYNLAAEIETIKANLGFDRLQQMRDNSPTGGALGQVAIQELVALQSTVANLDPDQSAEQLRDNLGRIREHYGRWRAAVEQSLAEERSQPQQGDASPIDPRRKALLDKY